MAEYQITHKLFLGTVECCSCHTTFAMTAALLQHYKDTAETFYCPAGHPQVFRVSTIDTLKEKLQYEENRAYRAERDLYKLKADINRQKRAEKWKKCPHCSKEFVKLERHIAKKHPEKVENDG